jgi:hypothetical protein
MEMLISITAVGILAYALYRLYLAVNTYADQLDMTPALDDPLMRDLRAELDDHTYVLRRSRATTVIVG